MAEARILYVATDDGLIQLANPGRSDRWREVGRALEGQPVRVVAAAPNDPLLIVAATADAVHRTTDGGFSWEPIWWQNEATALAFSDDGALYMGTQAPYMSKQLGVLRRQNGEHWSAVSQVDGPIKRLMAPVAQGMVFCTSSQVYGTLSTGGPTPNVQLIGVLVTPTSQRALVLAAPTDVNDTARQFTGAAVILGGVEPVLLLGTHNKLLRSTGDVLFIAADEDSIEPMDWVLLNNESFEFAEVPGPHNVSALVTPPRFIDQVFATTRSGELWFSADRGRTWAALRTDLPPANDLAFARAR